MDHMLLDMPWDKGDDVAALQEPGAIHAQIHLCILPVHKRRLDPAYSIGTLGERDYCWEDRVQYVGTCTYWTSC